MSLGKRTAKLSANKIEQKQVAAIKWTVPNKIMPIMQKSIPTEYRVLPPKIPHFAVFRTAKR